MIKTKRYLIMNNTLKPLVLVGALTFSSFGLQANPTEEQQGTQPINQTITIPVINPNTGKIEVYLLCEKAPDCETPQIMIQKLEEEND